MTLTHALVKSFTNFISASSEAYTSAMALNSELEPKIKSSWYDEKQVLINYNETAELSNKKASINDIKISYEFAEW